jgi:hypothetical protein
MLDKDEPELLGVLQGGLARFQQERDAGFVGFRRQADDDSLAAGRRIEQ